MRANMVPTQKWAFLLLAALLLTASWITAGAGYDPMGQSEAQTVYLGNLARQNEAGQPPLRWNQQLTHAARWFSWDSVENRVDPYCGHQDTLGGWPGDRALTFGYLGGAGAENAFCGYVTPQQGIDSGECHLVIRKSVLFLSSVSIISGESHHLHLSIRRQCKSLFRSKSTG